MPAETFFDDDGVLVTFEDGTRHRHTFGDSTGYRDWDGVAGGAVRTKASIASQAFSEHPGRRYWTAWPSLGWADGLIGTRGGRNWSGAVEKIEGE